MPGSLSAMSMLANMFLEYALRGHTPQAFLGGGGGWAVSNHICTCLHLASDLSSTEVSISSLLQVYREN